MSVLAVAAAHAAALHAAVPAAVPAGIADLQAIFGLPFMQRALLAILVLSVAAGVVGLFINFRELEFVSDGLVHAVFPGLVIGMLVGGSAALLPGAAVAAGVAALLFTLLAVGGRGRAGRGGAVGPSARGAADAGVAVVLTGLFSLGVVLVSRSKSYVSQLQELLFGRILTVTSTQLWQMAIVAFLAVVLIVLTRRSQLFRAFDPAGFESAGFSAFRTDLALNISVALLVVAGVQALGVLMVIAILVVPMAVARLVTRRLALLIPLAALVTCAAGFGGLWLSFELSVGADLSVSPGAIIVLLLVIGYGLAVGGAYAAAAVSTAAAAKAAKATKATEATKAQAAAAPTAAAHGRVRS